jgi:hypothetical protein
MTVLDILIPLVTFLIGIVSALYVTRSPAPGPVDTLISEPILRNANVDDGEIIKPSSNHPHYR